MMLSGASVSGGRGETEVRVRADAAANRKRVLAAAEDVFAERGAGASTEEVASRAGVGIGTVFRHFPAKRDLVEATLVAHLDELAGQAVELAASGDATAALHALLREAVRTGRASMSLTRHLLAEPAGMPEAATTASERLRSAVADLLDAARAAGDVRPDVGVDEVFFLIHGLSQAQETLPADDATRRRALDLVLDGLARPRPGVDAQPRRLGAQPGRRSR